MEKQKVDELKADIMVAAEIDIKKAIIRCLEAIRETPENSNAKVIPWHTLTFGDEKNSAVYRRLLALENLGLVTKEVTNDEKFRIEKTKWKPTSLGEDVLRTDWSSLLFRKES